MEHKRYYLSELSYFDGDHFVTFNIVEIDTEKIIIAITNEGKISVQGFDLKKSDDGRLFFEYGPMLDEIAVDNFEHVDDTQN